MGPAAARYRGLVFIRRAKSRFPSHDFSAVCYQGADLPVRIGCPIHGQFERAPSRYLASKRGCTACCHEAARPRKTPEQRRRTQLAYQRRHRALYNAAARKHYHANIGVNVGFTVGRACRNLLNRVLADTKQAKANPTAALLGYSFAEFKSHIEQQFEPWMSWANHGQWHVDHIRPVSYFVRNGITDPRVINALTNLRPLAKRANLMKKDKLVA